MRRIFLVAVALAAVFAAPLAGQRQRTTRPKVSARAKAPGRDTLALADTAVAFSNYDKPLRARRETVLATNLTADTLRAVELRVRYYADGGGQIHQGVVWVPCDLPPGQTRLLEWGAWDTNGSYYYRMSRRPRASATPYDVTVRALRAAVDRK